MPSVMGLLEERERAAQQRVEALQAELREAEAVWERFVIARKTVGEVLAKPRGGEDVAPVVVAGERPGQVRKAMPGSVVPHWADGLAQSSVRAEIAPVAAMRAANAIVVCPRATFTNTATRDIRMAGLAANAPLIRSLAQELAGYRGHIIVVTNPVDVLARVFATAVGPAARVYGIGSSTDSARYRLATHYRVPVGAVRGLVIGEHGDRAVTRRPRPRDTSTTGPLASRWTRHPRATKKPFLHAPAQGNSPEPGTRSNLPDRASG